MERYPRKRNRMGGDKDRRATGRKPHGDTRMTRLPWDEHRPFLEELYIEQNLALPDLMERMKKERGFNATPKQYRYRLKDCWGLSKYGPGGVKSRSTQDCPQTQRISHNSKKKDISDMPTICRPPSRDIAVLGPRTAALFTDKTLDSKLLELVTRGRPHEVPRCLRLCFRWCENELLREGAELTAPWYGQTNEQIDDSDGECGVHPRHMAGAPIFVYLLDRYVRCPRGPSEKDEWDSMLDETTSGFCPIRTLAIMGGLITTTFANVARDVYRQEDGKPYDTSVVDTMFDVARIGIEEMNNWGDNMLMYEFGVELEGIVEEYGDFGKAMRHCVSRYMRQTWPAVQVDDEEKQRSTKGGNHEEDDDDDDDDDDYSTGCVDVNDDARSWAMI